MKTIKFIIMLSVFTIIINHYPVFFGDQTITIPYIKHYHNPTLFPNDIMVYSSKYYISYLWVILSFFIDILDIRLLFFILYFISLVLFYCSIFTLSKTLFNEKVGYIASLLMLIPNSSLAGIPIIDNYLTTRTFTLPFLLFALNYLIKKDYKKSIVITGIMFNFHILSGISMFLIIIISAIINKVKIKEITYLIVIFTVLSLPSIIWKFMNPTHVPFFINKDWRKILEIVSYPHLFPTMWRLEWINLIYPLTIFVYLRNTPKTKINYIVYSIIILVGLAIISDIFNIYYLNAMQLGRSTKFLIMLSLILLSNYLINNYKKNPNLILTIGLLFFLTRLYFLIFGFLLFILSTYNKKINREKLIVFLALSFITIYIYKHINIYLLLYYFANMLLLLYTAKKKECLSLMLILFVLINIPMFIDNILKYDNLIDICNWINSNTKDNDIILFPSNMSEYMVIINRTTILNHKDGTLSNFFYNYSFIWYDTMNDLRCVDYHDCRYNTLNESDFIRLKEKYNFTYIITQKRLNLTLKYNNSEFYIYEIK